MKKWFFLAGLCTIVTLTGCAANTTNRGVYERSGNTLNVNNARTDLYNEGARRVRNESKDYGYVRQQKDATKNDNNNQYMALNREQLANVISKLNTTIPNVDNVSTLVTDQEVLIAYRTTSKDRNTTADQVKRTAMSVVPRYYHVYVTDNTHLRRDIENLSHLDSNSRNVRTQVNQVIGRMKKSPQGAPMNTKENANGETPDDITNRPSR